MVSHWIPEPFWAEQDVYIIGGGDSLRKFDWDLLRDKNTIGCNSAFILGAHICKILVFGDAVWWDKIGLQGTEDYGGLVVGCTPRLHNSKCPWLLQLPRNSIQGFSTNALTWCGNTAVMAMNLALILGARRVLLLGFDMRIGAKRKANWHDVRYEPANAEVYNRFISQMRPLVKSITKVFPGSEIINVTHSSNLDLFPKVTLEEHFYGLVGKAGA